MNRWRAFGMVVALCSTGQAAANAAAPFRDSSYGFSVEMPPRWNSVSIGLVGQLSLNVSKATGQEVNYVACFVPPRKTSSDFPKILVQLQPWTEPPNSYEQLEEVLRSALPDALKTTAARLPVNLESLTE